jgi:hypothetical protein
MARLEMQLEQSAKELNAQLCWLDPNNASIALMLSKGNLLVRFLVELNSAGKCVLLCSSSEGMGNRAPLTTAVLEQLPELSLSYRSDLDGPSRKPSSST